MYKQPTQGQIEETLEEASHATYRPIGMWRLVEVDPLWLHKREDALVRPDLVDLYKDDPSAVLPIVIAGRDVVDGHHRWMAAIEAGLKKIWAVEIR